MKKHVTVIVMAFALFWAPHVQAQEAQASDPDHPETGRGSIARVLPQRDPFAWQAAVERHTGNETERALGEAFLQLVFNPATSSPDGLQAWLNANAENIDTNTLVFVSAFYGERLMEIGEYERALSVFEQISTAVPQAAGNFENAIGILESFGNASSTRSAGAGGTTVETTLDAATLHNIPVEINGRTVQMIADTGAEFTLLPRSTADALGLTMDGETQTVGTSTVEALEAQFTIIPEIRIGEMRFTDIATTIVPDEALQFSAADTENLTEDYTITGVLGLPVFVAAGRVAWLDNGTRLAFGTSAPVVPEGGRIYWHRQGLGLEVDFGNGPVPVFFDSGARVSQTSTRGLLEIGIDPESLDSRTIITGGGGGFAEEDVLVLPAITFGLPGTEFVLEDANVYPANGDPRLDDGGYAGSDILKSVDVFAVDFESMRYRTE